MFLLSCEKQEKCPEPILGKPDYHLIQAKDLQIVQSIFNSYGINYDNLQFTEYNTDYPDWILIKCFQFVNNLKLISEPLTFRFETKYNAWNLTGDTITSIDIGTVPSMSIPEINSLFLLALKNDDAYQGNIKRIESGCFVYELGYFDLNSGTGDLTHDFRLAWRVNPDGAVFPYAIILDSDKTLFYYDNGIRY